MYDGPSVDDEFCRHFCLPSTSMDYIQLYIDILYTLDITRSCLLPSQATGLHTYNV